MILKKSQDTPEPYSHVSENGFYNDYINSVLVFCS